MALNCLGNVYYEIGDYSKAIEYYNKALSEESYDTPWHTWDNLGFTYEKMGKNDKARECYEEALAGENNPNPGRVWNNIGGIYYSKGEFDKSTPFFFVSLLRFRLLSDVYGTN